jgi:thymidylate synthase
MKNITKYKNIISQKNIQLLIGLDDNMLNEYTKIINENIIVEKSSYTYGSRLEIFKEKIINKLKNNINSRHAYATTIQYDKEDKQPPCMVYIQFLYDEYNKKLNLYVIFRSHDIFKGALANGYGLGVMLNNYSKILNVQSGLIEITSISAHIYKEDLYDAKLLIECVNKNIIFDEYLDKRGYCVFEQNNSICKIYDYNENKLINIINGTNIEIYEKLLNIFDNIQHLKYLYKILFIK